MAQESAMHRTVIAVDMEGFSARHRTHPNQIAMRDGLYQSLQMTFKRCGISWASCHHEDRGDGVLVLIPPDVPKNLLVTALPRELAAELRKHNSASCPEARIRLRFAIHAGEIQHDDNGVVGTAINLTFRLLDAARLKSVLATSPGVLALIASDWFYDEVIRHCPASSPSAYQPIRVAVKETDTNAWVCLPDHPYPPCADAVSDQPQDTPPVSAPQPVQATALAVGSDFGRRGVLDGGQIWNIARPTRRFASRRRELARLQHVLGGSGTSLAAVAVHGMPGVGKTQLAMAYAGQHRSDLEIGWWIAASSRLLVVAGLAQLAEYLGVGAEDQEQAARAAVAELTRRDRWLLVYDDAQQPTDLTGLIPNGAGSVVITSRNPQWDAIACPRVVDPLSESESVEFLLEQSGDTDANAASAIATEVQGLPLALSQAATYCRARAIGLAEYHDRFRRDRARLLQEGTPTDYPLPAAVTFRLSFAHAAQCSIAAMQLLTLLAFIAPAKIPRDVLNNRCGALPRELAAVADDPVQLDAAVEVLTLTSLVTVDGPNSLRVHQLVQELLREEIRKSTTRGPYPRATERLRQWVGGFWLGRLENTAVWDERRWAEAAVLLLLDACPGNTDDLRLWPTYTELQAHISACLEYADKSGAAPAKAAELRSRLATYLRDRGEYDSARRHFEQVLTVRQQLLGPEHPDTLGTLHELGDVLYRLGQFTQARQRLEQLAAAQQVLLGPEHHSTVSTLNILAFVLFELGEPEKARRIAEQILAVQHQLLGPEHLSTLNVRNTLAAALTELGEFTEARGHFEEIYAVRQRVLGPEHLHTQKARHNLIRTRADLGELTEARAEFEETVAMTVRTQGSLHPHTLLAKHNLARVLWKQGELTEARQLFEEVLATREQVIGPDHPKTLTTRHYLGRVLAKQGDTAAAREHLQRVIDARQRVLGANNPHTRLAIDDLVELTRTGTTSLHGIDAARKYARGTS